MTITPIFIYYVIYLDPWKKEFTLKFNTKSKRDAFVATLVERKFYFTTQDLRTSLTLLDFSRDAQS
jgi:hypothetical protein